MTRYTRHVVNMNLRIDRVVAALAADECHEWADYPRADLRTGHWNLYVSQPLYRSLRRTAEQLVWRAAHQ